MASRAWGRNFKALHRGSVGKAARAPTMKLFKFVKVVMEDSEPLRVVLELLLFLGDSNTMEAELESLLLKVWLRKAMVDNDIEEVELDNLKFLEFLKLVIVDSNTKEVDLDLWTWMVCNFCIKVDGTLLSRPTTCHRGRCRSCSMQTPPSFTKGWQASPAKSRPHRSDHISPPLAPCHSLLTLTEAAKATYRSPHPQKAVSSSPLSGCQSHGTAKTSNKKLLSAWAHNPRTTSQAMLVCEAALGSALTSFFGAKIIQERFDPLGFYRQAVIYLCLLWYLFLPDFELYARPSHC